MTFACPLVQLLVEHPLQRLRLEAEGVAKEVERLLRDVQTLRKERKGREVVN